MIASAGLARLVRSAASCGLAAPLVAAAPITGWLAVQTVVGFPRGRQTPVRRAADPPRFVVLVPAHNEAGGIGDTLESLAASEYPADLFSVQVVADNCTDETAAVVRRHGVDVHERDAADDPGKGPALNWLFDRLVDLGAAFEAVAIIDADTIVDPGFLPAMAGAIESGVAVAQGFYTVREPEASSAASLRFAALACRHHLRPQARCRMGASGGLYGNGMVFRRDVLADRRWSGHLVEDAELQIELLLDGYRVVYVPGAVVRAEMPLSLEHAVTQNRRWERGRLELARSAVPELIRRMRRRTGSRLALGDAVLDQVTPPISVLGSFHGVACVVAAIGAVARVRGASAIAVVHAAGVIVVGVHVVAGLRSVRAGKGHYLALLSAPVAVIWKVRLWLSVLGRGRSVRWDRTRRNLEVFGSGTS